MANRKIASGIFRPFSHYLLILVFLVQQVEYAKASGHNRQVIKSRPALEVQTKSTTPPIWSEVEYELQKVKGPSTGIFLAQADPPPPDQSKADKYSDDKIKAFQDSISRQQELKQKEREKKIRIEAAKTSLLKNPKLETEARIKYKQKIESLQKSTNDKIAEINNDSSLTDEQKKNKVQNVKNEQDALKNNYQNEFAQEIGFADYQEANISGIGDPSSVNVQSGVSRQKSFDTVTMEISSYIEYLFILVMATFGYWMIRCQTVGSCSAGSWIFAAVALMAMLAAEIQAVFGYKEVGKGRVKFTAEENLDAQLKSIKKAKQLAEDAGKVTKMKAALIMAAGVSLTVASVLAALEFTLGTARCASPESIGNPAVCACVAKDVTCESAVDGDGSNGKAIPFSNRIVHLFNRNTQADKEMERYFKIQNTNTDLYENLIRNAKNNKDSIVLYQQYSGALKGSVQSLDMNHYKAIQKIDIEETINIKKEDGTAMSLKEALLVPLAYLGKFKQLMISSLIPTAYAAGKTANTAGVVGALGIGVVLAVVFELKKKALKQPVKLWLGNALTRTVFYSVLSGIAYSVGGSTIKKAIIISKRTKQLKKVEDTLKSAQKTANQFALDSGTSVETDLGESAAFNDRIPDFKPGEYDLTGMCLAPGEEGPTPDENCECLRGEESKCLSVSDPVKLKELTVNFPNTATYAGDVGSDSATILKSLSGGDVGSAGAAAERINKNAFKAKEILTKIKKDIDESGKGKKDFVKIDDRINEMKNEINKLMKKNLTPQDLAALNEHFGAPEPGLAKKLKNKNDTPQIEPKQFNTAALGKSKNNFQLLDGLNDEQKQKALEELRDEAQLEGADELDYNQGEQINPSSGVPIWKVISARYRKSAYPWFLKRKEIEVRKVNQ